SQGDGALWRYALVQFAAKHQFLQTAKLLCDVAALNPTYSFGEHKTEEVQKEAQLMRVMSAKALSGQGGQSRSNSGRTSSGRPVHAGVQHGHKGERCQELLTCTHKPPRPPSWHLLDSGPYMAAACDSYMIHALH
ncbi:hypothetical protein QJQ45_025943, partial [Haematococcus lacustris]